MFFHFFAKLFVFSHIEIKMISIVANWAKSELVAALRFVISFGLDVCTSTSAILLSGLFPNCVNAMISIFMLFASSANATTSALLPEFETSQSTFFFSLLTSCGSKTWISFSKMIGLPTRDHFAEYLLLLKKRRQPHIKNSLCRFQTLYDFLDRFFF